MASTAIRKRLITYLAGADEKKVKAIFEEDIKKEETLKLTNTHIKILDQRKSKHVTGKDKSYSWQEIHDKVRKNRK